MPRPADHTARQAALDTGQSFIVQAPAGSGKTELLTQRYLKLLARVDRPERVLAITFTRKATREMQDRVLERLQQASTGAPVAAYLRQAIDYAGQVLAQDQAQDWRLLQNPSRLQIMTIDALCGRIAARSPLFSGGGDWEIIEDVQSLYADAAEAAINGGGIDGPERNPEQNPKLNPELNPEREALVRVLTALDGDAGRLRSLLTGMLARRDQWLGRVSPSEQLLARLPAVTEAMQRQELRRLESALGSAWPAVQADLRQLAAGVFGYEPSDAINALTDADGDALENRIRLAHYACRYLCTQNAAGIRAARSLTERFGFPAQTESQRAAVERIRNFLNELDAPGRAALLRCAKSAPLQLNAQGRALVGDLQRLLITAAAYLRVLFAERRQADFLHLAEAALKALGSRGQPSDLLFAEDFRLGHILMDEFQDTSRTQFELVSRLVSGWQPGDGRTLFLVGDPMQSIYRFREADLRLFIQTRERGFLESVALKPLTLSANFRSGENIVDFVNRQFQAIFPPQDEPDEAGVAFRPSVAEVSEPGRVDLHPVPVSDRNAMGDALYDVIEAALRDGHRSIAVLARSKRHLVPLAELLTQRSCPFQAVEIDRLDSRPIIRDLLSLTRALLHPHDRIAWIALLRAPWCGLRIAAIHQLLGDDPDIPVWQRLTEGSAGLPDEQDRMRVDRLHAVMNQAGTQRLHYPLHRIVELAWIQLDGPRCVLRREDWSHAERFFELFADVETGQPDDLVGQVTSRLNGLFAQAGGDARVKLMSIHKAKGLEFDTVIVPEMHRTVRSGEKPLLLWEEPGMQDGDDLLAAPLHSVPGEELHLYRYLSARETERDRQESRRLLYVAMTRARSNLHLFTDFSYNRKGLPAAPPAESFAALLWPSFEAQIGDQVDDLANAALPTAPATEPPISPLLRLKVPFYVESGDVPPPEKSWSPLHVPALNAVAFGSALHWWLECLHQDWQAFAAADGKRIEIPEDRLVSSLRYFGMPQTAAQTQALELETVLDRLMQRSDWRVLNLGDGHDFSAAELPLVLPDGKRFKRLVLDRVFGAPEKLTILDYKTGADSLDSRQRWRRQLGEYRQALRQLTPDTPIELKVLLLSSAGARLVNIEAEDSQGS